MAELVNCPCGEPPNVAVFGDAIVVDHCDVSVAGVTEEDVVRRWNCLMRPNRELAARDAEISSLRDQLRKVEVERDAERKHATEMEERALDLVRDLRLAQVELHALRALLPDARACAEYCRNILIGPTGMPVEDYPLAPVALAARRILAALDSQGGEGE